MSGFEHYHEELDNLDHEIRHYAAICGIDLSQRHEVEHCLNASAPALAESRALDSLRGLFILRIKLEAEMLEQGMSPAPLIPPQKAESGD